MAEPFSNKELFANWVKKFSATITFDDPMETAQLIQLMVKTEKERGISVANEVVAEENKTNFLAKIAAVRSKAMELPITGVGQQILLLGCYSPGDVVMLLSYTKALYELKGGLKSGPADSEFVAGIFKSTVWSPCLSIMWDAQKLPDGINLLDVIRPEDYV